MTAPVPVLEIGGTHVTAALIDPSRWQVVEGTESRLHLDGRGTAHDLIAQFAGAAATLAVDGTRCWGVAVPDPFDYQRGIALFEGVGKFESLYGVDIRAALFSDARAVAFVNDADAFALGEWVNGAGSGFGRCAAITLGTGVGSGWVVDGKIVDPGFPPGGRIHRLGLDGVPLEDVMSRRAIRRAYAGLTADAEADVREIAERARDGEQAARDVLRRALDCLGRVAGPCLARFAPDVLVVGGSMAASWDLFGPWFHAGLAGTGADAPPIRLARDAQAPLLGAAACAVGD
jgi:glucokinase